MKPVVIDPPQLLDTNGQQIDIIEVGQQARVRLALLNNLDAIQPLLALVEIRNGDGVTEYLSWHSAKLDVVLDWSGNYTFETSWMPSSGECVGSKEWGKCTSNYQIRAFAITDLESPDGLSDLIVLDGISVIDKTEQGKKLYRLEIDGKQYDIEYSLEGGYIENITNDLSLATTSVQVFLSKDTQLSIEFPYEVVEPIVCGAPRVLGGSDIDIEAFIDSISAEVKEIDTGQSLIWLVELELGTEEVEFVGCGFLP